MKGAITSAVLVGAMGSVSGYNLRRLQLAYDEAEAYQAVGYSSIASCIDVSLIQDWSCNMCEDGVAPVDAPNPLQNIVVFTSDDELSQVFIGYDPIEDRIVVSYQGTVNDAQTTNNLNLAAIPTPEYCADCNNLEGFYETFLRTKEDVIAEVAAQTAASGTNNILITGYSLGGAQAAHAAAILAQENSDYEILGITFGSPRVGNKAFSDHLESLVPNFFRVVNYQDPVPFLIDVDEDSAYHTAQEIWYFNEPVVGERYPANSYLVLDAVNGEDPSGHAGECNWDSFFNWCTNLDYHSTYMNLPTLTGATIC